MLMRFDPFREVDQLLRQTWAGSRMAGMLFDAYRRGDEFIAEFDLPGFDRDSIDVTVERNVLEVTAQRDARYLPEDEILAAERMHGSVTRRLFLGEGLDTDRISASYGNGVLTVRVPVAENAKPHRIEISSGDGATAVGSGAAA